MDEWLRIHPHWDHRVWTDENRPTLRNEESFRASAVASQRADILSYELVYRFGGVYLDTDMECLKSIDGLLEGIEAFTGEQEPGELAHGIFGSVAGHPWLEDVVAQMSTSIEQHEDILRATGPRMLTAVTRSHPEVKIFPPELFYPYLAHEPSRAAGPFPSAYAVHRWHGSWVPAEEKFLEDFPRELERELITLLPSGARVITLAEGIDLDLGELPVLPFTGREGYWGNPADSEAALAELERLTALGWNWLVILEDAYWWFEFYETFLATVSARAPQTHRGRLFTAFELPVR